MLAFNEAISRLSLVENSLEGCKYTWTNKQQNPLLERLDWFFSSNSWTTLCPITSASALSRDTSDHTPCLITASTTISKSQVFRFENYWLEHEQFPAILQHGWSLPTHHLDKAKNLGAKFKNLRRVLKARKKLLPSLEKTITSCKEAILFLDKLEEFRDLSLQEWNARDLLLNHIQSLLGQQRTYRKQRGTTK